MRACRGSDSRDAQQTIALYSWLNAYENISRAEHPGFIETDSGEIAAIFTG
jgi:hypothetical protein